ncbi:DUF4136 domain-containing protein [Colwellia sp. 4_MG-2023]|jgi:hypothetical protein|uniref:DUF4136 domain-containing protein n=1 Tax=unclassified Colwellia TaxID=196834 RepID=UPI001C0A3BB4|nr:MULTISPECIES: DUF4136 domain-containing protein [unclassified Colwellia]MBU2924367.1 DUF4136 domain-containing protein [Colwellia sp. C2M11]MDO6487229.1 DUF4136 domain-containing protein [Colwellia sp. 6_MG-2023]MDO6505408.1 DUF4136 domain-containing protein [Colwellia sp. 5_MG-2023]MDO6554296.1 DUF4136 domain-containing protein [Colwellia sp. 4_MG-2023]MDO6650831.1 DUF4136 domain-containing protein [Colwellia sp. 3_MG-2023]
MKAIKVTLVTVLVLLVASCASNYKVKVGSDKNENIDTADYKTFAWLTSQKVMAASEDFNPVMKLRVDEAIEKAFIAKGYQLIEDAEKADFTVSYTVGNRDKIKIMNYPAIYRTRFGWWPGYYGSMFRSDEYRTIARQYTEGKLGIDVYDVKLHQPVWHGWATKRITNDEIHLDNIQEVVNDVVAQFH